MPQMPFGDALVLTVVAVFGVVILLHVFVLCATYRLGPAQPNRWQAQNTLVLPLLTAAMTFLFAIALTLTPRISFVTLSTLIATLSLSFSVTLSCGLLSYSPALNARYGKRWVKALDFPYLFFGFFGLLRIVDGSPVVIDHYPFFSTFGLMAIPLALAVRLTKSTIEVFFDDWVRSTSSPTTAGMPQ